MPLAPPSLRRGRPAWARVVAVVLALSASAAKAAPAPEAEVFSGLDRRAVEVGGWIELSVEVVAPAETRAEADRWVARLAAAEVPESADVEAVRTWPVSERWENGVVEAQRRFALRVLREGRGAVPPVAVGPLATSPQTFRAYAEAPEAAARSVVPIVAEGMAGARPAGARRAGAQRRVGTAWLAAPDALVTAYHVVVGASRVRVRLPSGRAVTLRRAWSLDPSRDVAVLHIDPRHTAGMRTLPLAPAASPTGATAPEASGAVSFTAGWPLGAAPVDEDGFGREQAWTSAPLHASIGPDARRLRVSGNAVRPGDSGGPLLDARGRVLGVVVSGRSTGGEADLLRQDVGLAADPLPALRARGRRPRPLARALRDAARTAPTARAFAAATALVGPARRPVEAPQHRAALLRAAQEAPGDASLQFLAGSVLEALGEPDEAARAYHDAHAAGYFPAAYALAHHYLADDPARAAGLFAEVRRSAPYAHLGAMGHARALVDLGRWREAEAALRVVLDHDARYAPALYLLGVVRLAQGREGAARALVQRLSPRPSWAASLRTVVNNEILWPSALRPLARAELGPVPSRER